MLTYSATSYTCFALFQLASISSQLCRDHLRELRPLSPADVGLQIIWGGDKRIYSIDHHVITTVLFLPRRRRFGRCVRGSLTQFAFGL